MGRHYSRNILGHTIRLREDIERSALECGVFLQEGREQSKQVRGDLFLVGRVSAVIVNVRIAST